MRNKWGAEHWAAVSAAASAVAALAAVTISIEERPTPYLAALYTARWSAIEEYARASANLSTALSLAAIRTPASAEDPESLSKMSDAELLAAARAARPAIAAWGEYIAASSSSEAPWSTKVHLAVSQAEGAGRNAYECYRLLGGYVDGDAIPPGWWKYLRSIAAKPCMNFRAKDRENNFDLTARLVLRAMTDELRTPSQQFVPGVQHNEMD